MTARADLPRLDDLPIPDDVRVTAAWPASMREMADHVGALATLRISEARGGEDVYIPRDAERSPFADVLDADRCDKLARVYGGERLPIPLGSRQLHAARRAGVIAAVRRKQLTVIDGAKICGTTRSRMSNWVNQTDEGRSAAVPAMLSRKATGDPRQIDLFDAG